MPGVALTTAEKALQVVRRNGLGMDQLPATLEALTLAVEALITEVRGGATPAALQCLRDEVVKLAAKPGPARPRAHR